MKFLPIPLTLAITLPAQGAEQRATAPAMPAAPVPPASSVNLPAVQAPAAVIRPPAGQINAPLAPAIGMQLGPVPLKCSVAYGKKQPSAGRNPVADKLGSTSQNTSIVSFAVTNTLASQQVIAAGRTVQMEYFKEGYSQTMTQKLAVPLLPGQSIHVAEVPVSSSGVGDLSGLSSPSCTATLLP